MILTTPTAFTPATPDLPPPLAARFVSLPADRLTALGNLAILDLPLLASFCSVKVPGRLILQTYDLAAALRDRAVPVVGGFHTPIEREALAVLLRRPQSLVVCPARAIDAMRVPLPWRPALAAGRLLVLSPFAPDDRRPTQQLADQRNRLVAALAARILVPHATPGGAVDRLCRALLAADRPLFTPDAPDNTHLLAAGAKPWSFNALDV